MASFIWGFAVATLLFVIIFVLVYRNNKDKVTDILNTIDETLDKTGVDSKVATLLIQIRERIRSIFKR